MHISLRRRVASDFLFFYTFQALSPKHWSDSPVLILATTAILVGQRAHTWKRTSLRLSEQSFKAIASMVTEKKIFKNQLKFMEKTVNMEQLQSFL